MAGFLAQLLSCLGALRYSFFTNINKNKFGYCGKNVTFQAPSVNTKLSNMYIHDNVSIFGYTKFILYEGKFIVKRNCVIAIGLTVITGNHVATVGLPTILQCSMHINDVEKDVIVEESVWIGANVTLLAGVTIGRGAVIGAGSIVNKSIPPYAVAVGVPAKIVKVVFNKDQILKHEETIYKPDERLAENELNSLFEKYYFDKTPYGVDMLSKEQQQLLKSKIEMFL
ncbi:galactoside O-acetyltransferase [Bacteroidia bacterium]|nr:galactoside O-acetyltransferase [Bacteroidia bacterium]GHT48391.1 galactoside O-acetyltransferase [Bacteroidia bacterium]